MPFRRRRALMSGAACALTAALASSCINGTTVLRQQVEARQLAADLHVQFTQAADASNRAVMADTDEASSAAAHEAEQATRAALDDAGKLQPVLASLGYADELREFDRFQRTFDEYRKLDAEILPLSVQNTNLKAQRLSFGEGRAAVAAFRKALASAVAGAGGSARCRADAQAAHAAAALLEIEVIETQHIAEPEPAAMSRMEDEMAAAGADARKALDGLRRTLGVSASAPLDAAAAALDRFMTVDAEIVKLSRQNTNVRSLSLALGRKRTVTGACDDELRALEEALSKHEFRATR